MVRDTRNDVFKLRWFIIAFSQRVNVKNLPFFYLCWQDSQQKNCVFQQEKTLSKRLEVYSSSREKELKSFQCLNLLSFLFLLVWAVDFSPDFSREDG